jgi:tetratricopeptide (TPR) repeat protein
MLDEEVLFAMRKAGCQRISVGLESASPKILKSINKGITPELVLSATRMAKKFGLQIRYYVMAGNRGESAETLKTTIDFIVEAKPNEFFFSFLSLYPGTKEFKLAEDSGLASRDMFFSEKSDSFNCIYGEDSPQLKEIYNWINSNQGIRRFWDYSIAELEAILTLFPNLAAAHMDLGGTHYHLRNYSEAEKHIRIAIDMGYHLPSLGYNYLACIAVSRGDFKRALGHFEQAKELGGDSIIDGNLQSLRSWLVAGGLQSSHQTNLIANHDCERSFIAKQPMLPGPIIIQDVLAASDTSPVVFMPQQ